MEQVEATEDLLDNIIDIVHKYPVDINNNALVAEWSGIITSMRRIVNRVLATSDRYTILNPGTLSLNGSDAFFSARENGEDEASDNDSTEDEDDREINGANYAASAADDSNPDPTFHTEGDETGQELKGVKGQQVDPGRDALVEYLKHQWDQNWVMSRSRRYAYIKMNRIIDFISCHKSGEVTPED